MGWHDYDPSHPLKISDHAVFKVILGLTECYVHWDIIRQFEFSFTPHEEIYHICGEAGDYFLETPILYNGAVLKVLNIPRAYLRKHFPEDYAAHPSTFRDEAVCSPEFLSLSSLFEYINILFEVKEGRHLELDSPKPTRWPMAISVAPSGGLWKWKPQEVISDLSAYPSAMSETDAVARTAREEPAREDPLPRINIEPSKHIKL